MTRKTTPEEGPTVGLVAFASAINAPLQSVITAIDRGRLRGLVHRPNGSLAVRLEPYRNVIRAGALQSREWAAAAART